MRIKYPTTLAVVIAMITVVGVCGCNGKELRDISVERAESKRKDIKKLANESQLIVLGRVIEVFDGRHRDAGMGYELEVLNVLKGSYSKKEVSFQSGGWIGYAEYDKGETVLAFLKRNEQEYGREWYQAKPVVYLDSSGEQVSSSADFWEVEECIKALNADGIEYKILSKLTAAEADDGWTYKEGLSEPEWSPDGKWIAFTRELHKYMQKHKNWHGKDEVWIVSPDGSDLKKLAVGRKLFWKGPDVLAYIYHTNENEKTIGHFALINLNTGETKQLQKKPEFPKIQFKWKDRTHSFVDSKTQYVLSADKDRRDFNGQFRKLIYEIGYYFGVVDVRQGIILGLGRYDVTPDSPPSTSVIHVTSPDITKAKVIIRNANAPSLSYDGKNIVFIREGELWIKRFKNRLKSMQEL